MSQLGNRFKDETLTQTALGTEIKISSLACSQLAAQFFFWIRPKWKAC